ncbi:hypothetical protein GQ42DRAFT_164408, partial [Ramicandelaber brevisporus]
TVNTVCLVSPAHTFCTIQLSLPSAFCFPTKLLRASTAMVNAPETGQQMKWHIMPSPTPYYEGVPAAPPSSPNDQYEPYEHYGPFSPFM